MKMRENMKKTSSGTGLIEALVASCLVVLAALQSVSTFMASEKTVTNTGHNLEALNCSQATLETLTARGFDGVNVGTGSDPLPAESELSKTFKGQRNYIVEAIEDDETGELAYKKITVETSWTAGGKEDKEILVTMLSKPGAYDGTISGEGSGTGTGSTGGTGSGGSGGGSGGGGGASEGVIGGSGDGSKAVTGSNADSGTGTGANTSSNKKTKSRLDEGTAGAKTPTREIVKWGIDPKTGEMTTTILEYATGKIIECIGAICSTKNYSGPDRSTVLPDENLAPDPKTALSQVRGFVGADAWNPGIENTYQDKTLDMFGVTKETKVKSTKAAVSRRP